jgi:hypothetical protein
MELRILLIVVSFFSNPDTYFAAHGSLAVWGEYARRGLHLCSP